MKKFALLSVVLLASLAAQAYVPLVREGVKWVYQDEYNDFDEVAINSWVVNRYYTLEFKGDTIIDGMTYKKCYRKSDVSLNGKQNAMFCSDTEPVAFVREENGVVYSINKVDKCVLSLDYLTMLRPDFSYDSNEFVIYDFNKTDNAEVTTVEVGGVPCKAIEYNEFGLVVVEGIGVDYLTGGDLLFPVTLCSTGMWYSLTTLHHVEDAQGNIIYKGAAYQEPESHPFDLNGDGQVDISDVNSLIDHILGK